MTVSIPLSEHQQNLNPDGLVELFILDAGAIGGGIIRFSSTQEMDGTPIKWKGVEYPPHNFKTEGFSWDQESMPRPKISADVGGLKDLSITLYSLIVGYLGAQGATLYRIRTHVRYLDGHVDGGNDIAYPMDVFMVDRLISATNKTLVWELIAPLDLPNCLLPSRPAVRDICCWIYRRYNTTTSQFEYNESSMACPYTGTNYFNKIGEACPISEDECGRRLSDCVKRFGQENPLPYGGFPALARAANR